MSAAPEARKEVQSYKQLAVELEATQKKLKALQAASAATKKTADQSLQDAVDEAKRTVRAECEAAEAQRVEKERLAEAAREKERAEEAETRARDQEAQIVKRINDAVSRATSVYEAKCSELRTELLIAARQSEEQTEQLTVLTEYQKNAQLHESQWNELSKQMKVEIAAGKVAAANLERYRTLLKFMAIHKYVKDLKLKRRLLPLHTAISSLIALILRDSELRKRLLQGQAELARWVHDAHAIERTEGIQTELPIVGNERTAASVIESTTASVAAAAAASLSSAGQKTNFPSSTTAESTVATTSSSTTASAADSARNKLMLATNVDYLVASLVEVEHVLHTCVGTVLRYQAHFKSTAQGFFERNSGLTAHCMAVEKEWKECKTRAQRTQEQLHLSLDLLARLEVKYAQLARKLGKDERTLAMKYLARHGVSQVTDMANASDEQLAQAAEAGGILRPTAPPESTTVLHNDEEDLSMLSPRALHRRRLTAAVVAAANAAATGTSVPAHARTSSVSCSSDGSIIAPSSARQTSMPSAAFGTGKRSSSIMPSPELSTRPGTAVAHSRDMVQEIFAPSPANNSNSRPHTSQNLRHQSKEKAAIKRKKALAAAGVGRVDPYESSSSDEEFTLHPVSYTPPPSGAPIRAGDWEAGDEMVRIGDGVEVRIGDAPVVPTIAQMLSGEAVPSRSPSGSPRSKKKKTKRTVTADETAVIEEKTSDFTPPADSTVATSAEAEEKEQIRPSSSPSTRPASHVSARPPAASTGRRGRQQLSVTASTPIGGTPHGTASWAAKTEQARSARHQNTHLAHQQQHSADSSPFVAGTPLASGRARMSLPSPYQEPISYNGRDSNNHVHTASSRETDPAAISTRSIPRPPSSLAPRRIPPPPLMEPTYYPTALLSSRTRSPSRESRPLSRERPHSRERTNPAGSTSMRRRGSDSGTNLKPSPPTSTNPTSSSIESSTPKYVLNAHTAPAAALATAAVATTSATTPSATPTVNKRTLLTPLPAPLVAPLVSPLKTKQPKPLMHKKENEEEKEELPPPNGKESEQQDRSVSPQRKQQTPKSASKRPASRSAASAKLTSSSSPSKSARAATSSSTTKANSSSPSSTIRPKSKQSLRSSGSSSHKPSPALVSSSANDVLSSTKSSSTTSKAKRGGPGAPALFLQTETPGGSPLPPPDSTPTASAVESAPSPMDAYGDDEFDRTPSVSARASTSDLTATQAAAAAAQASKRASIQQQLPVVESRPTSATVAEAPSSQLSGTAAPADSRRSSVYSTISEAASAPKAASPIVKSKTPAAAAPVASHSRRSSSGSYSSVSAAATAEAVPAPAEDEAYADEFDAVPAATTATADEVPVLDESSVVASKAITAPVDEYADEFEDAAAPVAQPADDYADEFEAEPSASTVKPVAVADPAEADEYADDF